MLIDVALTDYRKPNNQFYLEPVRDTVVQFTHQLAIRKISGIGNVSEIFFVVVIIGMSELRQGDGADAESARCQHVQGHVGAKGLARTGLFPAYINGFPCLNSFQLFSPVSWGFFLNASMGIQAMDMGHSHSKSECQKSIRFKPLFLT